MKATNALLITALALVVGERASGQINRRPMPAIEYAAHSGVHAAGDSKLWDREPVYRDILGWPGTPLLRVHFAAFELGERSFLTLTSLKDNGRQILTAGGMRDSHNYSALFNGDAVELSLFAAPEDRGVFVEVDQLFIYDEPGGTIPPGPRDICGDTDDRVPSTDARVGRLSWTGNAPGGCTAWLVSNGAALTAGHCGTPDGNLTGAFIEFNVPPSSSNGTPSAALPQDQYPAAFWTFQAGGEGTDWSVFGLNPNTTTQQAAHRVQGFFRFTRRLPAADVHVRVTGYGLDPFPSGTGGAGAPNCDWDSDGIPNLDCNAASLTQQSHAGRFDALDGSAIEHEADTLPANSGSPVFFATIPTHAIGIHTNGGCDSISSEYDNAGTWFGHTPLANTLNGFQGPNVTFADSLSIALFESGHVLDPFNTVAEAVAVVPIGGTVSIVAGSYPAAAGNVFAAGGGGRAMRLTAPVGAVTIGN